MLIILTERQPPSWPPSVRPGAGQYRLGHMVHCREGFVDPYTKGVGWSSGHRVRHLGVHTHVSTGWLRHPVAAGQTYDGGAPVGEFIGFVH